MEKETVFFAFLIFTFLFSFQLSESTSANARSICGVIGDCRGSPSHPEEFASNVEECLQICKNSEGCNWYTYYSDLVVCKLLFDCPVLDESCTTCISGEASCETEPKGYTKLLVGLGNVDGVYTDNFEVIDLDSASTMNCTNLASFPLPIEGPIGGLGFDEKPLICGGRNGSNFFKECFSYEDNDWKASTPMTEPRAYAAIATSTSPGDSKLFAVGGGDEDFHETVEHLTEDGWRSLPSLPFTTFLHCLVSINASTIMFIGGYHDFYIQPTVYFFNTESQVWTEGPPMNVGRAGHACGRIRADEQSETFDVIVVGGTAGKYMTSTEIYDVATNSWRFGPELPFGISFAQLVEYPENGGVVLVGGVTNNPELHSTREVSLNTLFQLEHAGTEWSKMEQTLKTGRHTFTAFLIPDEFPNCAKN